MPPPHIEVVESEQYRNMAQVIERHGRKVITLQIRTDLEGMAQEVAVAEMLNLATVIEFQVSEIAKNQPWKIQQKWEALQPRRQQITVNSKSIERAVATKRAAGADVGTPPPPHIIQAE